ncbi:MAG TPA: potassium-transporting ATPase subunit C, partial [Candidatus Faecousia excrementipullorum]|nr:potassium-transporting ATPase subunit C [Candidatus Faecousia excrementipullorum]
NTQGKVFGVFGEETVNVLKVNIEIAQRMGIL